MVGISIGLKGDIYRKLDNDAETYGIKITDRIRKILDIYYMDKPMIQQRLDKIIDLFSDKTGEDITQIRQEIAEIKRLLNKGE